MVGFNPSESVHLSSTEHAFAGAVSGSLTRAICQPLDVLKIRFQLQIEPLHRKQSSKYHGIFQAVRCIISEEGLKALWKGHLPAQILSIFYGVFMYASFEVLTQSSWNYLPNSWTTTHQPIIHSLCGSISGCSASALIHPIDVVRTRIVAQGEPKVYKTLSEAFRTIYRTEGSRGFFKGLTPALYHVGPQMGIQFGLYTLFTGLWHKSIGMLEGEPPASLESLVCGSGSGLVAKLCVYPFDVMKKRLQVQGFEEARQHFGAVRSYSGLHNCLSLILREEKARGFYKGLGPSLLKAGAVAGLSLSIYEQVRKALMLRHRHLES